MLGLFVIALQAVPANNPSTWVTGAPYPPTALRNGEQGRVGYQLDVDSSGRVVGCRVTMPSGSPSLDAATCPHLSRVARFQAVEPSTSEVQQYNGVFTYQLEGQVPERSMTIFVAAMPAGLLINQTDIVFTVTPEGRVTNCRIDVSSGSEKLDDLACSSFVKKARFDPMPQPLEGQRFRVKWQIGPAR